MIIIIILIIIIIIIIIIISDNEFVSIVLLFYLSASGGEYTLFAPVDAAFAVYKDNLLDPSAPNAQKIYQGTCTFLCLPYRTGKHS